MVKKTDKPLKKETKSPKNKKAPQKKVIKTTEILLEEKPEKMVAILKKKFKDPTLFDKAIQLAQNGQKAGYERLEFLGDRVVGIVVAEMLYNAFPNEPEGDLAKRYVQLVCAKALAKIAVLWGINDIVRNNLRSFAMFTFHKIDKKASDHYPVLLKVDLK